MESLEGQLVDGLEGFWLSESHSSGGHRVGSMASDRGRVLIGECSLDWLWVGVLVRVVVVIV